MFGSEKKASNVRNKMNIRLNNFLYVFNLRQGTILIAVHQIALSSFILILFLVGLGHAGDALRSLETDMNDEVELYGSPYGEHYLQGEINTNNLKKFQKGQRLASVSLLGLYAGTLLVAFYTACCFSLLHGAIKSKCRYLVPWIVAACLANVMIIVAVVVGDQYPPIVGMFGGHVAYHCIGTIFVGSFIYAICAVLSFAFDLDSRNICNWRRASDERGEQLVLLDHAAQSSLLTAAQLNKLSQGTKSQFV